jgi:branched-chain amino acid transport system substrate-binding protein
MELVSNAQPWRFGVLVSQTGVTSLAERTQLNGTMLAIREINENGGINGRPLEPVYYDPESKPERFRELADRLLTEDRVSLIFGCYTSQTRKAILPVVERRNALLCYPTMYEGFEYSRNVFYGGASPNQNSVPLAHYMMETYGPRFYLIASDYLFPRETNRVFIDLVRQNKGTILAERYLPLSAKEEDFDPIIEDIARHQPDVIFSTVVGASTTYFYRAYAKAGFKPEAMPIASVNTNEAEVQDMGAEIACGHIIAAPYFASVATQENARFVASYHDVFGANAPITSLSDAAYFQVHMIARAIAMTNSTDTDLLRRAIRGTEYPAPQGQVRVDPDNYHTYLWSRIGRVDANGAVEILRETDAAVKPDPYLVSPQLNDWNSRFFRSVG